MGLVQNAVEGAGISTISMSVQPHITATVGVLRAVYLRYPAGNQVGESGKPQQQRAILNWALDAAVDIKSANTILELPYRWRRFPIQEEPVYAGVSHGARHPQTEEIIDALDALVRKVQDYKSYMEGRVAGEEANPSNVPGLAKTLGDHVARVDRLIEILDVEALDQVREIVNRITVMELRASGKFV